jgi:hypothetical protein
LVWVPATLLAADGEVCSFKLQNGEETTVVIDHTTLERVSEASIKGGLNNLVLLGPSACMRLRQWRCIASAGAAATARHPSLLRTVELT